MSLLASGEKKKKKKTGGNQIITSLKGKETRQAIYPIIYVR